MTTVTIPKELARKGDLVLVPRKEYEEFEAWARTVKRVKEFTPTRAQLLDLKRAREDYRKGKFVTLNELKRELGSKR
ncbi:MAG: hypothetical protein HYW65_04240 [Candidatus Liptonbacteria bacterium]|nr:hypothetical protein [Candidatus Liptonbacteria bacterium]